MKDKREGLSKEGSGRVAMFKTLGIIHSYTLECCYASGKVMNNIAAAVNTSFLSYLTNKNASSSTSAGGSSGCISPPLHSDIPPKFMPEHYMDVGKAVAIAALDIIEMNQFSRIPNTSFGNLEAVRNWIKFYIKSKGGGTGGNSSINTSNNNQSNSALIANNSSSNLNNSNTSVQPNLSIRKGPIQKSIKSNSISNNNNNNNSKNLSSKNNYDRKMSNTRHEIRNSIKQLKDLEANATSNVSVSNPLIARSYTSISNNTKNESPKNNSLSKSQSLLAARKANQNRNQESIVKYTKNTNRMENRKLMPITKANVLTDANVSAETSTETTSTPSNKDQNALGKPANKINLSLSNGFMSKQHNFNNQNRLNMLNIVINSNNQHQTKIKMPYGVSSSTSITSNKDSNLVEENNNNNNNNLHYKSNFELVTKEKIDEDDLKPIDEQEFSNCRTLDDMALNVNTENAANNNNSNSTSKKLFFSLSVQRPTFKFIRRTKSVFFT
jgi:hypothetical protein